MSAAGLRHKTVLLAKLGFSLVQQQHHHRYEEQYITHILILCHQGAYHDNHTNFDSQYNGNDGYNVDDNGYMHNQSDEYQQPGNDQYNEDGTHDNTQPADIAPWEAGGQLAEADALRKVHVQFMVPEYVTHWGQGLKVVGSVDELGSWTPSKVRRRTHTAAACSVTVL